MMKKIQTVEEAVQVCQECCLNVQFEVDVNKRLSGEEDSNVVSISPNPWDKHKGKDLVEAVNAYLLAVQKQKEALDKRVRTEEDYENDLYCSSCGEEDQKNLKYEANYGGMERWNCKCGHSFQIKPPTSE